MQSTFQGNRRIRGGDYDNGDSNNNNQDGDDNDARVRQMEKQQHQHDEHQELALAFRQAVVRVLHRFDQQRITVFDRLLCIFALYFADIKSMPFVKLIYDSQYREEFEELESFLSKILTGGLTSSPHSHSPSSSSSSPSSSNQTTTLTAEEMKQLLDELNVIVEAVLMEQVLVRDKIREEKESRRRQQQLRHQRTDSGPLVDKGDAEEEILDPDDYFDDADIEFEDDDDDDDEDESGVDNSSGGEDEGDEPQQSSERDSLRKNHQQRQQEREQRKLRKFLRRQERILELASFFKICRDFLESGQSVAVAVHQNTIHTSIADEAATLVARAGAQLPKALVALEALSLSDAPGIDQSFYEIVTKIAKFALARQQVSSYANRFRRSEDDDPPPPPPPPLPLPKLAGSGSLLASAAHMVANMSDVERIAMLNKKQTKQEAEALMERVGDALGADELAFVDEVVLNNQGVLVTSSASELTTSVVTGWSEFQPRQGSSSGNINNINNNTNNVVAGVAGSSVMNSNNNNNTNILEGRQGPRQNFQTFQTSASLVVARNKNDPNSVITLVKPERFAKLVTGYSMSRFNRTHYTAENPPPKQVMAYEFTLFYPGKSDPSKPPRWKLYPTTEKGWDDEFCYIEFDGGHPYAKVAYRIVNRKWDPNRFSEVFDPSGRTNQIFINQLGPCRWHSWKPTNQNLNKCLMKVKEKAKLTHYYGFYIQRMPEREVIYSTYGGPNVGRHYVRQSKSQKQFEHFNTRHEKVHHMYHQRFKSPHNTITGVSLWIWTSQWGVSEPNWGYNQLGPNLNGDRDSTNRVMESWGMKTVNVDDRTAPRVENLIPHRHKLYQHNFPWLKEPETNHKHGDADFGWKGTDDFDYAATPAAAAFDYSIMQSAEKAVATARGSNVASPRSSSPLPPPSATKKVAATSASSTSSSSSAAEQKTPKTDEALATAEEKKSSKKDKAAEPKA